MGSAACVVLLVLGLSLGNEAQNTTQCTSVGGIAQYKLSKDDETCLLLNTNISVKIQNKSVDILSLSTLPGADCMNDSICSNSVVQIAFDLTRSGCMACKLVFTFSVNTSNQWGLAGMNFTGIISGSQSPSVSISAYNSSLRFSNAANQTFRCNSQQVVSMNSNVSNITLSVTTSNLRVQAFFFKGVDKFDAERPCVADLQSLLIVPVAVGSGLAILVFVLLIGYLVSRFVIHRRKQMYNKVS
eukprot:Em0021g820a